MGTGESWEVPCDISTSCSGNKQNILSHLMQMKPDITTGLMSHARDRLNFTIKINSGCHTWVKTKQKDNSANTQKASIILNYLADGIRDIRIPTSLYLYLLINCHFHWRIFVCCTLKDSFNFLTSIDNYFNI